MQSLFVCLLIISIALVPLSDANSLAASPELLTSSRLHTPYMIRAKGGPSCECPNPGTQPPRTTLPRTTPPRTTLPRTTSRTSGGRGGYPQGTGDCRKCARQNFRLVNQYRVANGRMPVKWNAKMSGEAADYSEVMYRTRDFKHSNLPYWENIVYASGYYQWPTVAQGFFDQWRRSPGHNANMLVTTHKCMGVGIYGDGRTFYGTQVFTNNC